MIGCMAMDAPMAAVGSACFSKNRLHCNSQVDFFFFFLKPVKSYLK